MSVILRNKIKSKKAKIAVVGLGYVGLPLAVSFAKKGFSVFGLDKDVNRVQQIQNRKSYISDVTTRELAAVVRNGRLQASLDFEVLKDMDAVLICVPTPLKRKYTPDISYILSAVRTVCRFLKKNTLVVLESTTYPGTTDELIRPELEKSGLKAGKDFYLSFSPERIDPGNKQYDVTKITKVVGGLSPKCGELTKLLYEKIIQKIHVVSSTQTAEMTKLLENSFRIINIGWINEVAMISHKLDIDVWEVIEAAKTKPFGFMPFYPGLGVGGHCIPDDPLYLFWKAKKQGFHSKFIKLSADVNSLMPEYTIERLKVLLRSKRRSLSGAKILILGVTYKKDVKDLRKSPALTLIRLLQKKRVKVSYSDPIIPYLKLPAIDLESVELNRKTIARADCVLIATDHTKVDYSLILKHARAIFDTRNVYGNVRNKKVVRL